jgi:uncharacterized protein YbjT (DUF2867 family)
MTLVVGATGMLGTEICRQLAAAGRPLRAMVRKTSDPAKKSVLKQLGAEFVEADLKDRTSLDRACDGATAVITTPTAINSKQEEDTFQTVDLEGQMHLVDAARVANVERFIFISVSSNLGKHGGNPLVEAKRSVENHLRQSGLTYTILRPSFFMEIWLSPHLGFDFQNAKATVYGSGKNRISYISFHDVAQFAAKVLSNPVARNAVIGLGGAEALSPIEVVRIFEEIAGRPFAMQFVPEEALQARRAAANNPVEQTFADLTLAAAQGDSIDMSDTLQKFSLRPKSVREYAKTLLDSRAKQ